MTPATQLDNEVNDAAKALQVKNAAIIKILTTQRDGANNAVVNALSEKAVVEMRLEDMTIEKNRFQQAYSTAQQANGELRIAMLNLQKQLEEAQKLIDGQNVQLAEKEFELEKLRGPSAVNQVEVPTLTETLSNSESEPEDEVTHEEVMADLRDRNGHLLPNNLDSDWADASVGEQDSLGTVLAEVKVTGSYVTSKASTSKNKLFPTRSENN